MKVITRTILVLSLVSLFTDMASEMLYPIMPVYLRTIGFSFLLIGVLEGLAEAIAGLSKAYFGKSSDASGQRMPFVQWGYALSAISKPMLALFVYPLWIFLARTIDRFGKGIRTGARDALLSDESTAANKGQVFGFHRGMDTLGAVVGPLIALIYLYFHPAGYKRLFLIAFVPGICAILFTFFIKEKKHPVSPIKAKKNFLTLFSYWTFSNIPYKKLVFGLLVFALFNSSDAFLLLKLKETGLSDASLIGMYIFYNLVYALSSYPLGILADKLGLKKIFLAGLVLFAIVYAGFAINNNQMLFYILFFLYGLYAAATEGVSKAWVSNIVPQTETATAIGTFTGLQSLCALVASSLTGLLWVNLGAGITFTITSCATVAVIVYLSLYKTNAQIKQ